MALLVVLCGTHRLGTSEYRGLFHCLKRIHVNTKVQFCFVCPEDLNHLQVFFSLYAFLILLGDPFWNFYDFLPNIFHCPFASGQSYLGIPFFGLVFY